MNNCQKHRNHHCVHSHSCSNPAHKKKQNRTNSASKSSKQLHSSINGKYHPPMGVIQDNQQCQFVYGSNVHHQSPLIVQALNKQILQLTQQLKATKLQFSHDRIQSEKNKQRNLHLQCQIQYLRQQLDLLVSNHNTDISKQIRKNLIQNTSLNLKIKQLTTALSDSEKKIEELSSQNYGLGRKNKQLESVVKQFQDKVKTISIKNEQISFTNTQLRTKIKQLEGQLKLLKDRYSTLASSVTSQTKQKQSKLMILESSKQQFEKSAKNKNNQLKRIKQLHQIEKKAWQKMLQDLRLNLQKNEDQVKRYKQKAKTAEQNFSLLKDDFQHAKKMILKYQQVNEECQKFKQQTKHHIQSQQSDIDENDKKTLSKLNKGPQQHLENSTRIQQLQHQNNILREKIQSLETKISPSQFPLQNKTNLIGQFPGSQHTNVIVNEELILSIGASEQFKKIVQQKNATIKKLMRQKTQLYNQIYLQQLHAH